MRVAIEEFGSCVAERIGGNVDTVVEAVKKAGADAWKEFIDWFRSLRDSDRALFLALLAIGSGIIVKLIEAAIGAAGAEIAAAIIILLGIAAWSVIIEALYSCSDRLTA
jgi:hypothetical protein